MFQVKPAKSRICVLGQLCKLIPSGLVLEALGEETEAASFKK